jgi:benzoyl-CoA reductase subunit B
VLILGGILMEKVKRLEGQKRLAGLIANHYNGAREIEKTKTQPIAWTTTGSPNEILWAMDFYVQFPEAYSATCGARHVAHQHCEVSESHGYEHHLCTYCRNSVGATLSDIEGPGSFEPLARPDFLLTTSNSCILITKWWEHLSRSWMIPLINIDSPVMVPAVDEKDIYGHVKRQCENLIKYLEGFTGKKFDYDRLKEVVTNAKSSADGYREMLNVNKKTPVAATFFDLMGHNFPNLVLRYKPETGEHYRMMAAEMNQRVRDGISAMPNMKYRVYWDGIPYWFAIKTLSEKLQQLDMCLVTSNYFEIFTFAGLDPARPLDSIAETTAKFYLNRSVEYKAETTEKLFRDYHCDAGIFAYALSCKPFSISMHYIADRIQNKLDVPVTIVEGDLVDETFYNEEKNNIKLQALAETIASKKK